MGWSSLKLVMVRVVQRRLGARRPDTILMHPEMSFDQKKVNFTKSWLMNVSSTEVGSHPLRRVTSLSHSSFQPTVDLSLDGDNADISEVRWAPSQIAPAIENALYQAYKSNEKEIANALKKKADRWFEDNVLPKYIRDVKITSLQGPRTVMNGNGLPDSAG